MASGAGVLLLQLFEPPGLIGAHATIFFAPTVVGLNTHADLSGGILCGQSLAEQYFSFPQMMDNLLRSTSLCGNGLPPSWLPNPN